MILLTHIVIALSSLIFTTVAFFTPSETKLRISYGFIAATIGSGTLLVVSMPSHLVSACYSGLTYLGVMLVGIFGIRLRLSHEKIRNDQ
jgi:hypothetical protein